MLVGVLVVIRVDLVIVVQLINLKPTNSKHVLITGKQVDFPLNINSL